MTGSVTNCVSLTLSVCTFVYLLRVYDVYVCWTILPSWPAGTVEAWMTGLLVGWVSVWVTGWPGECLGGWVPGWLGECVGEWVTGWLGECVGDWLAARVGEWLPVWVAGGWSKGEPAPREGRSKHNYIITIGILCR